MRKLLHYSSIVILLTQLTSVQFFAQSLKIENLVARADLLYDSPVIRSEEGMPVGNGRMGNQEMVRIANATYDSYFPDGINKDTKVFVLSKLAVTGTMMGRKDATKYLIPNQIRTAEIETMQNRMTGTQSLNSFVAEIFWLQLHFQMEGLRR